MGRIEEKNLTEFKRISEDRLSPDHICGFMVAAIAFCSLMMTFIIAALFRFGWDYYARPFEKVVVELELVFYSLQVIFLIFYSFPKARFKYQKLQTIVLLFNVFQIATIPFTMFVLPGMTNYSTNYTTLIYMGFLFLGAIMVHILTTYDTFKVLAEGESSHSFFSEFKVYILLGSCIYILILAVLIITHNNYAIDIYFGYGIATIVMYALAFGAAEFELLAYCRFNYPSFHVSWEEHQRKRRGSSTMKSNRKTKRKKLS